MYAEGCVKLSDLHKLPSKVNYFMSRVPVKSWGGSVWYSTYVWHAYDGGYNVTRSRKKPWTKLLDFLPSILNRQMAISCSLSISVELFGKVYLEHKSLTKKLSSSHSIIKCFFIRDLYPINLYRVYVLATFLSSSSLPVPGLQTKPYDCAYWTMRLCLCMIAHVCGHKLVSLFTPSYMVDAWTTVWFDILNAPLVLS